MKNSYFDLIHQSHPFPQGVFKLENNNLTFHNIPLKKLIEQFGSPLRLMFLPRIRKQIQQARKLFANAMKKLDYGGAYVYCYCTKSSHFAPVVRTALGEGAHLETSSELDIDLVWNLYEQGRLEASTYIVHNGFKTEAYLKKILWLRNQGFSNSIIVIDSMPELKKIKKRISNLQGVLQVGIRMAIEEEPHAGYHSSRHGIRPVDIPEFVQKEILNQPKLELQMVHFFVDTGIKDSMYYWGEFQKAIDLYATLKKKCSTLSAFNIGGGFPIQNKLNFEYDYAHMVEQIIQKVSTVCTEENCQEPDIFTEFGRYTVGESGAMVFSILEQKQQSDEELWYIMNNSLMNTIPDAWSNYDQFILLPINKWENAYRRVKIGGMSCDHTDFYHSEDPDHPSILPVFQDADEEPLYIGFFHTGAYQDSISGYGGTKHCLIPAPKMVFIDQRQDGDFMFSTLESENMDEELLKNLGYIDKKFNPDH